MIGTSAHEFRALVFNCYWRKMFDTLNDKFEKIKVFISNPNAKINVEKKLEAAINNLSYEIPLRIEEEMETIEKEVRLNFK